mgnify:CR=1 FL=1|jgi:thiamine-triphosphatase
MLSSALLFPLLRLAPRLPQLNSFTRGARQGVMTSLIEVERKFEASVDAAALEQLVVSQGGREMGQVRFCDTYYDTADCTLTRDDTWLRKRGDQWELKLPIEDDARRSGGERTVFREVEGGEQVAQELRRLRPDRFMVEAEGEELLDQIVRSAELSSFAEFETVRSKLSLGQCMIDLDASGAESNRLPP